MLKIKYGNSNYNLWNCISLRTTN